MERKLLFSMYSIESNVYTLYGNQHCLLERRRINQELKRESQRAKGDNRERVRESKMWPRENWCGVGEGICNSQLGFVVVHCGRYLLRWYSEQSKTMVAQQ